MTNLNFIKTLTAGVALAIALYPQAWAHSWATKTCDDPNGYACYNCGSDCTATLYRDGRLVVSGTGVINGGSGTNSTFSNSDIKPTSLIIEEGISTAGNNAFWEVPTIKSLELPNSFTTIEPDGLNFRYGGVEKFIIGENSALTNNIPMASTVTVVCKGNVEVCRGAKSSLFASKGVAATFTDELRDGNGKLLEKWSSTEHLVYDENGNIIARYTKSGDLLASYIYNDDKSIEIYDGNGKLTGLKNARSITPAQAAALVKKGNHNTVTLTFK